MSQAATTYKHISRTHEQSQTQPYTSAYEFEALDHWHLAPSDEPYLQSKPSILEMPSRNSQPTTPPADRTMSGANDARWRFNGTGQLVDESTAAGWDLSDEIGRLNMGDGPVHDLGPVTKMPTTGALHLDTSPLESSDASLDDSPHPSDRHHARGASTDSSSSSQGSGAILGPSQPRLKISSEVKERPHSFSGGLSAADLRRLQQADLAAGDPLQQQWAATEQPIYPSLMNQSARPYEYRGPAGIVAPQPREEIMVDYGQSQRNYPQSSNGPSKANNGGYRQNHRYIQGGNPYQGGHHASHMSLGTTQQLYDMMSETHPAVTRVQQQHNVFRPTHHHSASDPSAIREVAALAMMNNGIHGYQQPMFGQLPPAVLQQMYPGQYYAQEGYMTHDLALAAAQLQRQYTGYGSVSSPGVESGTSSPGGHGSQSGPSANNRKLGLYKTELCRSWEEKNACRYGAKCQFAHGEDELRNVSRHPKYKTEICRTFWVSGSCPYGKRCCFIHTELPPGGVPKEGMEGVPSPPPQAKSDAARARSMSASSDGNEPSVSLLARISAKRSNEALPTSNVPVDMSPPPSGFAFGARPAQGALRVDTSVDGSGKQNKSAYPSFTSNGVLLPAQEPLQRSPVPVTAGPDLGRHSSARGDIVGYSQQRMNKAGSTQNPNARHSFNGTEFDLNFTPSSTSSSQSPPPSKNSTGSPSPRPSAGPARASGHTRSGSAGNWGSFSSSRLSTPPFPQSSSPPGEGSNNHAGWSTSELAVGSSRLSETWA